MSEPTRSDEPHDKLTRLCATMTDALEVHPEYEENERVIILIHDDNRGGIVLHGYEDDQEAVADMLFHLKAMFQMHGQNIYIVPVGGDQ